MARRSSARLRARKSTTPQPKKSTSQDDQLRAPNTAPQLASVAESSDEMPGAFPRDDSDMPAVDTPTKLAEHISNAVAGRRTPKNRQPRPSDEEMHPEKYHNSTTKPLDEARWLGISAMGPHTEPPSKVMEKWAPGAGSPTKSTKHTEAPVETPFEFTFRAQSLELSDAARQMMAEKREEAARIKREMIQIEEEVEHTTGADQRKKATAKSKSGRYSDVHKAQFKKMDSIANHASASRPNSRDQDQDFRPASRDRMQDIRPTSRDGSKIPEISKIQYPSLKRSGSRAGLKQDGRERDEGVHHSESVSKENLSTKSKSPVDRDRLSPEEGGSPAKRVKLASPRTTTIMITTPSAKRSKIQVSPSKDGANRLSHLSTPTKASLARAATVKANKTSMIPSLTRTPSKSASKIPHSGTHAGHSLLARSPTKFAHMSAKKQAPRTEPASPLLAKSPGKAKFAEALGLIKPVDEEGVRCEPLLSRSPSRLPKSAPNSDSEGTTATKTPLLARTPARPAVETNPFAYLPSGPGPQSNLMDRFKLLRKSPIKSILRTPQRLYSDDPEKIAAGTHFATPPTLRATNSSSSIEEQVQSRGRVNFNPPATEPVIKHVDFSASTKSDEDSPVAATTAIIEPGSSIAGVQYPSLPPRPSSKVGKESKRRQTLGPLAGGDFTFRAETAGGITFGPSPSAQTHSPKPSIRHVSADPAPPSPARLGSIDRKRKFVEEDDVFAPTPSAHLALSDEHNASGYPSSSDKENDSSRPNVIANRLSPSVPSGKQVVTSTRKARASMAEPDTRPSKRVRAGAGAGATTTTTTGATSHQTGGHVPIWAKGTAAQQARASLAATRKEAAAAGGNKKRPGYNHHHHHHHPGTRPRSAPVNHNNNSSSSNGPTKQPSPHRGGDLAGDERESAERDGAGDAVKDNNNGNNKAVLSRARLEALSRPKRRVGA